MRAPHSCQVILLFYARNILPSIDLRSPEIPHARFRHYTRAPPRPVPVLYAEALDAGTSGLTVQLWFEVLCV